MNGDNRFALGLAIFISGYLALLGAWDHDVLSMSIPAFLTGVGVCWLLWDR